MNLSKLRVILEATTAPFNRAMRAASGVVDRTSQAVARMTKSMFSLKGAASAMLAVFAVQRMAAIGKSIFDMGAAVEETQSKFSTVFGQSTKQVQAFIDEFATLGGLSNTVAQDLTATTGAIVQGMGFAQAASADLTEQILRLSADLASFNNLPTAETLAAVQSALVGEREQLKRLGIVLREADVQQRALTLSGKTVAKELTQQEKVLATVQLLYERSGVAVGDLARTQDSAANTAKRLAARIADLKDRIASGLLTPMAQLLGHVDDNAAAFDTLGGAVTDVTDFMAFLIANIQQVGPMLAVASAQIDLFVAKSKESKIGDFFGLDDAGGLKDFLVGLNPLVQAARFGFGQFGTSVEEAEQALFRMQLAADITNREIQNNLLKTLNRTKTVVQQNTLTTDDATAAQLALVNSWVLTKETMAEVVPVLDLVSIGFTKIRPLVTDLSVKITRLDRVVADFATDFADRIARAVTEGKASFAGFVEFVIQGLIRIAAQMAVFNLLKALIPGSGIVASLGASLGIAAVAPAGGIDNAIRPLVTSGLGRGGLGSGAGAGVVVNQTVNNNYSSVDARGMRQLLEEQKNTIGQVVADLSRESFAFRRQLIGG